MAALLYRGRPLDIKQIPVGKELILGKGETIIGSEFEVTPLGHAHGAITQYRGPYGAHLREYLHFFKLHRDRVDPRTDPIGHLVNDAPDDLAGLGLAVIAAYSTGGYVYERRKDVSEHALLESLLVAGLAGLYGYALVKWVSGELQRA